MMSTLNTEGGEHSLEMSHIMTPDMVNFGGNIHGGHIMRILDGVAYACSIQYARCDVVTLSADRILFRKPIHVGDLVTFLANVNYVGTSSIEVGIKVISENLKTGKQIHAMSCFFTFVAVDENMKPKSIPPMTLIDTKSKMRFEEAKHRKELRLKLNTEHEQRKTNSNNC
jgi:acyl-CoA hydrolase